MNSESTRVIKKNMTKLGEPRPVGSTSTVDGQPSPEPSVRIVEKSEESALVEVVCTCGATIRLRCDYQAQDPQDG